MRHLILIFTFFLFISCSESPANHNTSFSLPYDLNNPDEVYHLPKELKEISGISFFGENILACIQDEKGIVFLYDLEKKEIIGSKDFGKSGDYEDIAVSGSEAYILKSSGDLYYIKDLKADSLNAEKIESGLSGKYDGEGLFWDENEHVLLIACKGFAGEGLSGKKAIYRYDPKKRELDNTPVYTIDLGEVDEFLSTGHLYDVSRKIQKTIKIDEGLFKPSALAIHPFTNDIYILSSVNKLLVILNNQGDLQYVFPFDNENYLQPEGITFNKKGDLYISNEGNNGKPNILKVQYNETKQ